MSSVLPRDEQNGSTRQFENERYLQVAREVKARNEAHLPLPPLPKYDSTNIVEHGTSSNVPTSGSFKSRKIRLLEGEKTVIAGVLKPSLPKADKEKDMQYLKRQQIADDLKHFSFKSKNSSTLLHNDNIESELTALKGKGWLILYSQSNSCDPRRKEIRVNPHNLGELSETITKVQKASRFTVDSEYLEEIVEETGEQLLKIAKDVGWTPTWEEASKQDKVQEFIETFMGSAQYVRDDMKNKDKSLYCCYLNGHPIRFIIEMDEKTGSVIDVTELSRLDKAIASLGLDKAINELRRKGFEIETKKRGVSEVILVPDGLSKIKKDKIYMNLSEKNIYQAITFLTKMKAQTEFCLNGKILALGPSPSLQAYLDVRKREIGHIMLAQLQHLAVNDAELSNGIKAELGKEYGEDLISQAYAVYEQSKKHSNNEQLNDRLGEICMNYPDTKGNGTFHEQWNSEYDKSYSFSYKLGSNYRIDAITKDDFSNWYVKEVGEEYYSQSKKFVENIEYDDKVKRDLKELLSIRSYTDAHGTYEVINTSLRTGEGLLPIDSSIKTMISGLNTLQTYKGTVFRSVDLSQQEIDRYIPGVIIREIPFTSTSKSPSIAKIFPGNVLFVIETKKSAKDISNLSHRPNQEEVLFPPGTDFEVTEVVHTDNIPGKRPNDPDVIIYLEEFSENSTASHLTSLLK